jgi:hypothetical protein
MIFAPNYKIGTFAFLVVAVTCVVVDGGARKFLKSGQNISFK